MAAGRLPVLASWTHVSMCKMFVADRPDRSETRTLTHSDHLAYQEVVPCRRQGLSRFLIYKLL